MSEDLACVLVFEGSLYIAWYIFDLISKHDDDNNNPFAGWW